MYRRFVEKSEKIYRAADRILISSGAFSDYFAEQFGICDTFYLPQYAEAFFSREECRKVPDEYTDLMFAGNIGAAQSVDTIIKAAALCKDVESLRWHIVGDGIALEECMELAKKYDVPVIFHGRQATDMMPRYYAMADAMLITMKDDPVIGLTMPGKLQSYMAAGKPVIGAIGGEARRVIEQSQCGYCVSAGDYEKLAAVCRKFADERSKYDMWGSNARAAYEELYSKEKFISTLESHLRTLCSVQG